jgi:hypothetical protein
MVLKWELKNKHLFLFCTFTGDFVLRFLFQLSFIKILHRKELSLRLSPLTEMVEYAAKGTKFSFWETQGFINGICRTSINS